MGKYLKKFENHTQYETYINGDNVSLPNVSLCVQQDEVHYNPKIPVLYDYLYSDGSFGAYDATKTAIGVCV